VTNAPGILDETTADLVLALLLAAARRLPEAERALRAGSFRGWSPDAFLGQDIYGKTLGIIGMGRIGLAVGRRARGFGMGLVYTSPRRSERAESELAARPLPLDELLRTADFVSLHCPLNPSTRHLIDAAALAKMKRTAVLINTARGPVVDEGALATALAERRIAAAALDVYEREPNVHPDLLRLENVVLAPHIGSASEATRTRMALRAAENVLAFLDGRPLLNPV
jgi:lactate dehydrogenase-like 2-hydroxyacid dehydrogenase